MIVVDTSALMAILRQEADANAYLGFMSDPDQRLVMAAPTFVEAAIAAERRLEGRGGGHLMQALCEALLIEPQAFTVTHMAWAVEGYQRFGIGRRSPPAVLNYGDCFTYGLAMALNAPILFKGDDFNKTDARLISLS